MTMDMPWRRGRRPVRVRDVGGDDGRHDDAGSGAGDAALRGVHRGRGGQRATAGRVRLRRRLFARLDSFSVGAALAQWGLHEAAMLSPAMRRPARGLSGAILMAAGIYQLTPFKGACLSTAETRSDS